MFRAAVIVFGAILSHYFLPWMTLADVPPNHSNHYDSPTTIELSRRLDELVDLRAKDVKHIGDLVDRVTQLEYLLANDMRNMTRKIQQLEDGYTKDKLEMTRRVTQLEQRHASVVRNASDTDITRVTGSQRGVKKPYLLNTPNVPTTDKTKVVNNVNASTSPPKSAETVDDSDVIQSSKMAKKGVMYSTRLSESPTLEDGKNPRIAYKRSKTVGHWNSTSLLNVTPIKGDKGTPGNVGPKGHKGDLGPKGDIGPVGPRGLVGIWGHDGRKGNIGPGGPPGQKGETGASGGVGPKGDIGPDGPIGPVGPGGPPGQKGGTGASGVAPPSSAATVAFHVERSGSLSVSDGQIIAYDREVVDQGHGYSPTLGIYTVPESGTYVLTWTTVNYPHEYVRTQLVVNGVVRDYSFSDSRATGEHRQSTGLVVLTLQRGNHVYIRAGSSIGSGTINSDDDGSSTFSGWKLS